VSTETSAIGSTASPLAALKTNLSQLLLAVLITLGSVVAGGLIQSQAQTPPLGFMC